VEDSKYPQVSALPERRVKKRKRTALWDMVTRKEAQSLCFLPFGRARPAYEARICGSPKKTPGKFDKTPKLIIMSRENNHLEYIHEKMAYLMLRCRAFPCICFGRRPRIGAW
jgi:hypothetical protein